MSQRRVFFDYDGHRFEAAERVDDLLSADPRLTWDVRMDGATVLEFRGEFPYRDDDVRKRILEWYEIQKPRPGARPAPKR
jgi:hypothetical protein